MLNLPLTILLALVLPQNASKKLMLCAIPLARDKHFVVLFFYLTSHDNPLLPLLGEFLNAALSSTSSALPIATITSRTQKAKTLCFPISLLLNV